MGRKKIEIRPLVDERNRNVTFLKRKAGLMKKAWELSVLCAADVSIIIFSAAGKAYEFSSQDLDGEIERYHDYEGMIERRRAPEFAAMALAGDDEEDDEDDVGSRRGSLGKKGVAPNGQAAPPRSLKGKESFKARTVKHRYVERSGHAKSKKTKGKGYGKTRDRSQSEKRSFIDGILSDESSGSDDGDVDGDDRGESYVRRRRDETDDFDRERGERKRERASNREAESGPVPGDHRSYSTSDKMMAGLHYALNMHHVPGQSTSNPVDYAGQLQQRQDPYDQSDGYVQASMNVPNLPRLPPDAVTYRTSNTPTMPLPVSNPSYPPSQGSASTMGYYGHSLPHQGAQHSFQPQQQQSFQQHANTAYLPPSAAGPSPVGQSVNGSTMQWDQGLLTRYAEYQLQQNHQRQQRLLLERQRQQLADLGVPVDERSLLDDIFGGVGGSRASNTGAGAGTGAGGSVANGAPSGIPDVGGDGGDTNGGGEFIWPLANGGNNGGGATGGEETEGFDMPEGVSHKVTRGEGDLDWMEGLEEDRHGLSLPSPVSNGTGEVRRGTMREREGLEDGRGGKKVRV
ncbi:hypothetical protein IAR55_000135 [Kwoniella newhampshirensis]|uniref:MADS-box domain-containing protein n=1 Tax=Kwoniella newhampshirensis TaxID=1651941 RepID=A0AAW0Z5T1_9TREE